MQCQRAVPQNLLLLYFSFRWLCTSGSTQKLLFLTRVMPPWVVRRERVRYRLDNFLFVNSSNSAEDLTFSRMILNFLLLLLCHFGSAIFRCYRPSNDNDQSICFKPKNDLSSLSFQ